ncbi:glycosyltransferase family 39 protein [Candidatus Gottesmanbacteria bacterium]|nr:glycosyltransferase family 39 protein [Candidatus Gottesmanbacteria bacterium]
MFTWIIQHSPLLYLTQSIWRDEAFSILAASRPLSFIFQNLGIEPPLYYLLLHFWMKLFGTSEIAARSLSFLGFGFATVIVIYWAEKLFKRHWLSWYLPLIFFVNPMLVYYAFEVRTYGWFMFFAVLSFFAYLEKRWKLFIIANVLGFYNHTYMLFVPLSQALYWAIVNRQKVLHFQWRAVFRQREIRSFFVIFALMIPWIIRIAQQSVYLKHAWYFPVDIHLVKSVLGNMFVGYEGTPWYLWPFTAYLSIVLVCLFLFALAPRVTRRRNLFFFLMAVVPLTLVIGVSFVKPLFVNRYLIPVTVAEVFLVVAAVAAMKRKFFQYLTAASFLIFSVGFNVWYPPLHAKVNIRKTFQEVNALRGKQDVVLAQTPLVFFESVYYSSDPKRVYLYNPGNVAFPVYVGSALVSPSQMALTYPPYPMRGFLIHEDGTYDIVYTTTMETASKNQKRP